MSHIVKGRVSVAYQDKDVLIKALQVVGNVYVDERLYRVGVGFTSEKYSLVLVDKSDTHKRIGYNLESGVWSQFQEDWGSYGRGQRPRRPRSRMPTLLFTTRSNWKVMASM